MKIGKKTVLRIINLSLEIVLFIPIFISALFFKIYTKFGGSRFKNLRYLLQVIGVYPIRDHYYEPLFKHKNLKKSLRKKRFLPGIEFNIQNQIKLLKKLSFGNEFVTNLELEQNHNILAFQFNNGSFESGDAEFLYQIIRYFKPKNIIEIGSGNSTKIALMATDQNLKNYKLKTNHLCIEPYEMKWLEKTKVNVLRDVLENINLSKFSQLKANDLLFIDSSHIIRTQGDVLKIYLEILPILKSGVIVHIHDIFSPRDYLDQWVLEDIKLWNEQYILEALISNTERYQIIASLNYLKYRNYKELKKVCPFLTRDREPGSIYIRIK